MSQNNAGQTHFIELSQVNKIFKTSAGDFQALKDINMVIDPGEFVSVVGKSGSGKSTLINMITGIDHPTTGQVRINGTYLHQMKEGETAIWRGKNMGIVFQFFQLLPTLTVLENVLLPMDFADNIPFNEREKKARQLLTEFDLLEFAHKSPATISGGHQQCVAIARAMANDPPIILADEPTGNLDTKTAEMVLAMFDRLVEEGKTIIMVTHDHDLANRSQRQLELSDGVLVGEVSQNHNHKFSENLLRKLRQIAHLYTFQPEETIEFANNNKALFFFLKKGEIRQSKTKYLLLSRFPALYRSKSILPGDIIYPTWQAGDDGAEIIAFEESENYPLSKQEKNMIEKQIKNYLDKDQGE